MCQRWAGRTGVECYQGQTTKYVANKVGANFGSFGKGKVSGCGPSYEIPYCLWGGSTCTAAIKVFDEHGLNLGVNVDITEFHVYDEALQEEDSWVFTWVVHHHRLMRLLLETTQLDKETL